jgi:serine protease
LRESGVSGLTRPSDPEPQIERPPPNEQGRAISASGVHVKICSRLVLSLCLGVLLPCPHARAEHNPVAREPRAVEPARALPVIVKLRKDGAGASMSKLATAADRIVSLQKRTGLSLVFKREISPSMLAHAIELGDMAPAEALARLRADPAVEYVAPDHRRFPHATEPNDPLFPGQWYLRNTEVAAVNAVDAWDRERGSAGVVVAVLDTGVLYDHPDLGRADRGGRLLPGYDFLSAPHMTNDGDARDLNPADPGDWVSSADQADPLYGNCEIRTSSWHGTRVAGIIGARTNNSGGVSGLSWSSLLLPVRVLGKCGGTDSDILAGMRWAAGLPVAGAPPNPTPARIVNASMGSTGPCEPTYRDVIAELTERKVLLVISAGNEGTVVSSPANCPGVASVAAIRHAGSKVGFSSLGTEVTIAAPGGNCVNINGGPCLFSLDTTSNDGVDRPAGHIYTDQLNSNLGTSFSAPIVSGVAALMVSRNGNLSTVQLLDRLREGARPFPTSIPEDPTLPTCHVPANEQDVQLTQCLCTTLTCGAGMVDAARAVEAASRPIAAVRLPIAVAPGQSVTFDASASAAACNRTLTGYAWSVVDPTTNPPTIQGATSPQASVIAPASGTVTLRLVVTDDEHRTDAVEITLEPQRATSEAPPMAGTLACLPAVTSGATPVEPGPAPNPSNGRPSGGGGGGGGAMDPLTLVGLLLGALLRRGLLPGTRRCN